MELGTPGNFSENPDQHFLQGCLGFQTVGVHWILIPVVAPLSWEEAGEHGDLDFLIASPRFCGTLPWGSVLNLKGIWPQEKWEGN